ncbi:MAG: ATP-dependent protease subunit HslV [Nitrospinota bacterium]|jgi:ATP-dependent HslUV protease subunit HslV|nr:ATP-dependent protease subunit HslV [Nitrospinota bacterium]MDP7554926.1 ATP-dependent protease subunit HslV [Nitrospinota bacterium]MDP7580091.1 ATP-dependent protease subunit HslV [Nitrospinota bacterium]HJN02120.1 ATP-dependent protease subunit HslV [Nitrospinota bacterium]|tara:strand:+ start:868 stop:1395 length:528 start_codon:yes stop_codon:yes gene_type:complete
MFKGTTILLVRRNEKVVIAGDGQVSFGNTVMKHKARKVRKMYKEKIIAGFAGSVADAFALFSKFEEKLEKFQGNLSRSAVELAKDWRTDKILRRLEALMAIADKENSFILSGTGEVIEPDDGIIGIGSGGPYAIAAAKALLYNTEMEPREVAEKAMKIAASVCVYTNDNLTFEEL